MNPFEDQGKQSAFNEGMLQIQRLHFLWIEANNYSRTGNYARWRWTLNGIWRELTRDAIRKEDKTFDPSKFKDIGNNNQWFKEYSRLDREITEFMNKKEMRELYNALSNLDIFLRFLQDAIGKGGKYRYAGDDLFT